MAKNSMIRAVTETLKSLELNPASDARAQLALILAATLDDGAGMATAAVARELRATLTELESRHGGDDVDAFTALLAELSAPMVDPSI